MEPLLAGGLPHHRAIVALDIEHSTSRPDPVKAELRNKTYEMFDAALCSAGIHKRYRDRFIDRGDGLLALIHPVDQAPKVLLLNRAIPAFSQLLTDHNASLPRPSRTQRQLRVRVVVHAGKSTTTLTDVSVRHWTSRSACSTPLGSKERSEKRLAR